MTKEKKNAPEADDTSVPAGRNLLTIVLLLIILLMSIYAVFGNRGVLRIIQTREQKKNLEQQLAQLQQQQQELRLEIERLKKDKNYWEYLARTRLDMVREGELIYHLPDPQPGQKKPAE